MLIKEIGTSREVSLSEGVLKDVEAVLESSFKGKKMKKRSSEN